MKRLVCRLLVCVSLLALVGASLVACGGGGSVLEGNVVTPVANEMYGQYAKNNGDTILLGNPNFYQIQNSGGQTVEEGTWSIEGDKIVLSGSDGYLNLMDDGSLKDNLGKYWVRDVS